jgi:non-specific serine/threonine protein kinase
VAESYERCLQVLRELGLEPSEETQALAFRQTSSVNIPVPLNSFIGRKKELKEVLSLLSKSRLVTLTGSGGVGKTRLAIQAALEVLGMYPDGIWFFNLSFLSEAAHVPNALISLLNIRNSANFKQPVHDLLKGYLRSRKMLIIFDNCEHLIEACAALAELLLQACENLCILATSREPLRIAGEIPYRVPSLEIPRSIQESMTEVLANTESVRLFIERAVTVAPGFVISPPNVTSIAKICLRLDGIPLAIELAAARVNTLSVEQILDRLDDRFNLLTHGLRNTPARHQTLRATIEWSYELLSEKERLVFMRLGVFVGGWTLEAAEAVCSGKGMPPVELLDLLSRLVDKSLVTVDTLDDVNRYRRLETIRQYARERFVESDEANSIRTRHMKYFLYFAERAEAALQGPAQTEWYARINDERDNLRAALQWADQSSEEAGLLLSGRLRNFWEVYDFREGTYWLGRFLQKPESNDYPGARAKALYVHGQFC